MYLREIFYCTLHLRKEGISLSGLSPILRIIRNSDGKYLNPSTSNWNITSTDISLTELATTGIYQYELDITIHNNTPESYTLLYKVQVNGQNLEQSEQIYYERKNTAKLV